MRKAEDIRGKRGVLARLKAEEAQDVLHRLLAGHPELGAEAQKHARSLLGEVTFEAIADEVEGAVRSCDLDDLSSRAGPREWGYVGPTQAAWDILEETVEPFLSDIKRRIDLGLKSEALEICKGVVLGLYRVGHGKAGELHGVGPRLPRRGGGGRRPDVGGGAPDEEGGAKKGARVPARVR